MCQSNWFVRGGSHILLLALGFAGCTEGDPGRSRLLVMDPEDSTTLWERSFKAENVAVSAAPEETDTLSLTGQDRCHDAVFRARIDARTGENLEYLDRGLSSSSESTGGRSWEESEFCSVETIAVVELASGERRAICSEGVEVDYSVRDVETGEVLFRLEAATGLKVFGDHVLLIQEGHEASSSDSYIWVSLKDGVTVWTTSPPASLGPMAYFIGATDSKLFFDVRADDGAFVFALRLQDGSVAWDQEVDCVGFSLTADVLCCSETVRSSTCPSYD